MMHSQMVGVLRILMDFYIIGACVLHVLSPPEKRREKKMVFWTLVLPLVFVAILFASHFSY
jgi:hypothetical protein